MQRLIHDTAKSFGTSSSSGSAGGDAVRDEHRGGTDRQGPGRGGRDYRLGCAPVQNMPCDPHAQTPAVLAFNASVMASFPSSLRTRGLPLRQLPQCGLPRLDATPSGGAPWGTNTPIVRPILWRNLASAWDISVTPANIAGAQSPFSPDPALFVGRVNQLMGYTLPDNENIPTRDMDLLVYGIEIAVRPTGQVPNLVATQWDGVNQSSAQPDAGVKGPISVTVNASAAGVNVAQRALIVPFSESLSDMARVIILAGAPIRIGSTTADAQWAMTPWSLVTNNNRYGAPRVDLTVTCSYYGNRLDVGPAPGTQQVADAVFAPRLRLLYDKDHLLELAAILGDPQQ